MARTRESLTEDGIVAPERSSQAWEVIAYVGGEPVAWMNTHTEVIIQVASTRKMDELEA
jgi:hypothetical protein